MNFKKVIAQLLAVCMVITAVLPSSTLAALASDTAHVISLKDSENGKLSFTPEDGDKKERSFENGEDAFIAISPDDGYILSDISITSGDKEVEAPLFAVDEKEDVFGLSAVDKDYEISASFEKGKLAEGETLASKAISLHEAKFAKEEAQPEQPEEATTAKNAKEGKEEKEVKEVQEQQENTEKAKEEKKEEATTAETKVDVASANEENPEIPEQVATIKVDGEKVPVMDDTETVAKDENLSVKEVAKDTAQEEKVLEDFVDGKKATKYKMFVRYTFVDPKKATEGMTLDDFTDKNPGDNNQEKLIDMMITNQDENLTLYEVKGDDENYYAYPNINDKSNAIKFYDMASAYNNEAAEIIDNYSYDAKTGIYKISKDYFNEENEKKYPESPIVKSQFLLAYDEGETSQAGVSVHIDNQRDDVEVVNADQIVLADSLDCQVSIPVVTPETAKNINIANLAIVVNKAEAPILPEPERMAFDENGVLTLTGNIMTMKSVDIVIMQEQWEGVDISKFDTSIGSLGAVPHVVFKENVTQSYRGVYTLRCDRTYIPDSCASNGNIKTSSDWYKDMVACAPYLWGIYGDCSKDEAEWTWKYIQNTSKDTKKLHRKTLKDIRPKASYYNNNQWQNNRFMIRNFKTGGAASTKLDWSVLNKNKFGKHRGYVLACASVHTKDVNAHATNGTFSACKIKGKIIYVNTSKRYFLLGFATKGLAGTKSNKGDGIFQAGYGIYKFQFQPQKGGLEVKKVINNADMNLQEINAKAIEDMNATMTQSDSPAVTDDDGDDTTDDEDLEADPDDPDNVEDDGSGDEGEGEGEGEGDDDDTSIYDSDPDKEEQAGFEDDEVNVADSGLYSKDGIVFDVFKGSSKIASITTNTKGYASLDDLDPGTYTIKEASVPGKTGLNKDAASCTAEVKANETSSKTYTFKDTPKVYPLKITITKDVGDNTTNDTINKELSDTRFKLSYYNRIERDPDKLPNNPTAVLENIPVSEVELGDEFAYQASLNLKFPRGTILIEEMPRGDGLSALHYQVDNKDKDEPILVYCDNTREKFGDVKGKTSFKQTDKVKRANIHFVKKDESGKALANVPFILKNLDTQESYTITTDKDGAYASKDDKELWFAKSPEGITDEKDDSRAKLTLGRYELKEQRCESNKGCQLVTHPFTVTAENEDKDIAVSRGPEGAEASDGVIIDDVIKLHTTAKDKATGSQFAKQAETMTIIDTVEYEGLVPDVEYVLKGTLMDKETGKPLEVDGEKVTSQATFTPKEKNGTTEVVFEFKSSALNGHKLVVFEKLYEGEDNIADHEKIDDVSQTVYIPEIGTTALDKDTSTKDMSFADSEKKEVTLVDTIAYKNLEPNKEYVAKGVLMDKKTGKEVLDASGNKITAQQPFTPEAKDGKVEVTFTFSVKGLENADYVVFEDVYHQDEVYATHADIEDYGQTVYVPDAHTQAHDGQTNNNSGVVSGKTTIVDKVYYDNLQKGKAYEVSGVLMDKDTKEPFLDADGKQITASGYFVAGIDTVADKTEEAAKAAEQKGEDESERVSGFVDLTFTLDSSLLAGKSLVVFEDISYIKHNVAVHHEIEDEEQTIHFPKIGTMARDPKTDEQILVSGESVTLVDTVSYENLVPGTEYVLTGKIMDKETGEPLKDAEGKEITKSAPFVAKKATGTQKVEFTFDTSALEGKRLVVFEKLFTNDVEITQHEEINDVDQTVYVPQIRTMAVDSENLTDTSCADGEITIVDTVSYTNLLPGVEYTVSGKLMDKDSGKPLLDADGKEITATSAPFTPEGEIGETVNGKVEVSFTFKTDKNFPAKEGVSLVVFEKLIHKDIVYCTHEDIEDQEQTIYIPRIGTMALDTDTLLHVANPDGSVTIQDEVAYHNLQKGKAYTMKGVLVDKATGKPIKDADGKEITASQPFFAGGEAAADDSDKADAVTDDENATDSETVTDNPDATDSETVTDGQDASDDKNTVDNTDDETVTDENQNTDDSETVTDGENPTDENNGNDAIDNPENTGDENVAENPEPAGTDAENAGDEANKEEEIVRYTGDPTQRASGTVVLTFKLNASALAGKTVVAFEEVYDDDKLVAIHKDATDEDQSVHFPKIRTTATAKKDGKGGHTIANKSKVTMYDLVDYKNLVPNKQYRLVATLMDKGTKKAVTKTELKFTPKKADGKVSVPLEFNSSKYAGKNLVVFERLYGMNQKVTDQEKLLIATHEDYNDKGQTVKVAKKPKTHKPGTGGPSTVKTGDTWNMIIFLGVAVILLAGGAFFFFRKKKNPVA